MMFPKFILWHLAVPPKTTFWSWKILEFLSYCVFAHKKFARFFSSVGILEKKDSSCFQGNSVTLIRIIA